jgi:SAM-dependent methyltransferase
VEAREYELMAGVDEQMWWYRLLHAVLIATLRRGITPPVPWVLDAGCGTGGLLARLGATCPTWRRTGLDGEPRAASIARRKSGAAVAIGDINQMPFTDAAFDAIVSSDVLCHRNVDQERALSEFRRCLRPGGLLVLNLPAYKWLFSDHDVRVYNARRYSSSDAREMVERAGFSEVRTGFWNATLFPLMAARRKLFHPSDGASDVHQYAPLVEAAFRLMTWPEKWAVTHGLLMPFGGSILVTARH